MSYAHVYIPGHQRLVADDLRILHRDVSAQNVLLGKDGAPEGERGVLIDFDLAFRATESEPTIKADYNVVCPLSQGCPHSHHSFTPLQGLRIFQSVSVLSTVFERLQDTPHDYLDDLQSFFYLLVYIMLLFRPDGSCVPGAEEGPSIILSWDQRNPRRAFAHKERLTGGSPLKYSIGKMIRASWGRICEGLFMQLCAWTLSRRGDKERIAIQKKGPEVLLPKRDEHYSAVLEMFDQAIQAVKSSPAKTSTRRSKVDNEPTSDAFPAAVPPDPVRRSARIRDLVTGKATSPSADQPRRSARIEKRRLEEEKDVEVRRPRAKRAKVGPVTRRSR